MSSLSRKDKSFLTQAMKLAELSDCENRHGALIVKGSRVLSMGINKFRNCPKTVKDEVAGTSTKSGIYSFHAEVVALKRAKDVSGASIYVARVNHSGDPMLSRPCDKCMENIIGAGIKRVIYT